MDDQIAAAQRGQVAGSDNFLLTESRFRAGIDPFLNVLVAQRSYYTAQTDLVQAKATQGHNRVALYQTVGGDSFIENSPICPVNYLGNGGNATIQTACPAP